MRGGHAEHHLQLSMPELLGHNDISTTTIDAVRRCAGHRLFSAKPPFESFCESICARMAENAINLGSLAQDGRNLLSIRHPSDAHSDFNYWCDRVATWVDEHFPESGLSADWSAQPISLLVVGNQYDSSHNARVHFHEVVATRLKWLSALGKSVRDQAAARDSDTHESDSLFAEITQLVAATSLPQQFKAIVCSDIAESQKSYRAAAYKGCVVMLGAALEGIMLGTLLRSDVITHLSTSSMVPRPIRHVGSRDPALSDKIGNELSFEDYKVCIHELVPGSAALGVDHIQDFRNAIHPWKSIQEPLKYGSFDRSRALHYVASLHKIVQALHDWTP